MSSDLGVFPINLMLMLRPKSCLGFLCLMHIAKSWASLNFFQFVFLLFSREVSIHGMGYGLLWF